LWSFPRRAGFDALNTAAWIRWVRRWIDPNGPDVRRLFSLSLADDEKLVKAYREWPCGRAAGPAIYDGAVDVHRWLRDAAEMKK
jgi:hypothetical protein